MIEGYAMKALPRQISRPLSGLPILCKSEVKRKRMGTIPCRQICDPPSSDRNSGAVGVSF
jgi:hypothetical protein